MTLLAATPVAHAASNYPKPVRDAMANGVAVVTTFPAASGLTGWVLQRDGTYSMAFTTGDGKTLIMGTLINEKGVNLTDQYAEKHFPKLDRMALYKQLEQSTYIVEGSHEDPKSVVYAFVDMNCVHCRLLWRALQPYQQAGLQVRWIPVASVESDSMQKAIEILGAKDKAQALREAIAATGKFSGTAERMRTSARAALATKIKENSALMEKFNLHDLPVIVWKDRTDKVQVKTGMPRLSEISGISGLPQQKISAPELVKYK